MITCYTALWCGDSSCYDCIRGTNRYPHIRGCKGGKIIDSIPTEYSLTSHALSAGS